jgi:ribonuclease HII
MSIPLIAGIDEAGRGPLAGPVVAAACILPTHRRLPSFIRDSKQLAAEQREEAFAWIQRHCTVGLGLRPASFIDLYGILAATEAAMQAAVAMLARTQKPTYLLVDGRDNFWFDYPHSSIIRGDALEPCIAAASIAAKVARDRIMREAALLFPGYAFEVHKGYGTPKHFTALRLRGPCAIHRRSFLQDVPLRLRNHTRMSTPPKNIGRV